MTVSIDVSYSRVSGVPTSSPTFFRTTPLATSKLQGIIFRNYLLTPPVICTQNHKYQSPFPLCIHNIMDGPFLESLVLQVQKPVLLESDITGSVGPLMSRLLKWCYVNVRFRDSARNFLEV